MFDVQSNKYMAQCAHWTIRMPLIMIKKGPWGREGSPLCMILPLHVLPCSLALPPSPNHSTTEWLHSLWSQSAPISPRYKLCLHTVSADHLLVRHCLLKTEMTEHGGGRGGRLSGVVLVCSSCVWHKKRDTAAPISEPLKASSFFFLFVPNLRWEQEAKGKGEERNMCVWEREKDG